MFADLHLHTRFSDGTFTPEEVATLGHSHGLHTLALTDHDTVEGCPRMRAACQALGLEFIAGTELTAELQGHEIHVLAYEIDLQDPHFLAAMARFQTVRQSRIHEMVARLNHAGIPLTAEAVLAIANCNSPGRPHVARALVEGRFCRSLEEAFERFLKQNRPAWVPKCKMSAGEALTLIHQAGGVAVLAHPGLNRCDDVIPELVAAGLDGIECFHTRHSNTASRHYLELAKAHGLLVTGGSDCHGMNKGKPLIGSLKLPYEYVRQLQARAADRRRANLAIAI